MFKFIYTTLTNEFWQCNAVEREKGKRLTELINAMDTDPNWVDITAFTQTVDALVELQPPKLRDGSLGTLQDAMRKYFKHQFEKLTYDAGAPLEEMPSLTP